MLRVIHLIITYIFSVVLLNDVEICAARATNVSLLRRGCGYLLYFDHVLEGSSGWPLKVPGFLFKQPLCSRPVLKAPLISLWTFQCQWLYISDAHRHNYCCLLSGALWFRPLTSHTVECNLGVAFPGYCADSPAVSHSCGSQRFALNELRVQLSGQVQVKTSTGWNSSATCVVHSSHKSYFCFVIVGDINKNSSFCTVYLFVLFPRLERRKHHMTWLWWWFFNLWSKSFSFDWQR